MSSIISISAYGKKVSVEYKEDEITLDQLMEAYKSLALGLGFPEESFNNYITEVSDDNEHHSHRNCHHMWGDSDHDGHEECLICGLLKENV
jgi:hypothetical protein